SPRYAVRDPRTTIGSGHLRIAALGPSVRFYEAPLGFTVHRRDDRTAWLGAGGPDLLVLTQCEQAPRVRGTTGLYHFAVLVPTREDLARALRRLVETDTVMQGAADHGVSEALYLADVDGNGIEIYSDRPRAEWPFVGGRLQMGADPLDFDDLLNATDAAPPKRGPTHSTLGTPPPPPGAIGLRYFDVKLPTEAAVAAVRERVRAAGISTEDAGAAFIVRDPANNAIRITRSG